MVGAAVVGAAVVGVAVVGAVGVAGLAAATFGAAGDAALFVFVGAAGAVGAMFAAGVEGVPGTDVPGAEFPEDEGVPLPGATGAVVPVASVVCPTGAAFGLGTIAAASA